MRKIESIRILKQDNRYCVERRFDMTKNKNGKYWDWHIEYLYSSGNWRIMSNTIEEGYTIWFESMGEIKTILERQRLWKETILDCLINGGISEFISVSGVSTHSSLPCLSSGV